MRNSKSIKIVGIKATIEELKNFDIISYIIKDDDGQKIKGTFEGVKKLKQSRNKTTNQAILETIQQLSENMNSQFTKMEEDMNSKFTKMEEDMNSRFEKIDSRLDKMDSKLNLIIQCPTIQKEIDHEALNKLK